MKRLLMLTLLWWALGCSGMPASCYMNSSDLQACAAMCGRTGAASYDKTGCHCMGTTVEKIP